MEEKGSTKKVKPLFGGLFDWAVSSLPDHAQTLLTRYSLFVLTCLGLRRIPVELLRGPINSSGRNGTLLVAGHDPWVGYLPNRFFLEEPTRERVGNVLIWDLPALLQRVGASADLTIVRVDRLSAKKFSMDKDYLVVPEWVGMRLAVPDDLDLLVHNTRSIREDMRLTRKHNLQPLVTDGEDRFEEFYHAMYVPFSRARHGDMAVVKSQQHLRRCIRKGGILWVNHESQPLAGMLFERKNHTLDLQAIGMKTKGLTVKKRGIMAALYYFTIAYARRWGCFEVDFRGSRPSLHDGLLRYKRKWGNTLYEKADTYYDLCVRWNDFNGVVKEFLSHTSLIFRDGTGLSAIHTDQSLSRRSLWIGGLDRLYLLSEAGRVPMMDERGPLGIGQERAECSPR